MSARVLKLAVLLLGSALSIGPLAVRAATVPEAQLKAAFLYNFIVFTQWPARTDDAPEELELCVPVDSALRTTLQALDGRPVQGRTLRVVAFSGATPELGCGVLLIDPYGAPPIVAPDPPRSGQLTIHDRGLDTRRGGAVIEMARDGEHIRFDIDGAAAGAAQLQLSSKLLHLAREIY